MPRFRPTMLLALLMTAIAVAGCSTLDRRAASRSPQIAGGEDLAGAQGKTIVDQQKIDRAMARQCAAGIVSDRACDIHTQAAWARRQEILAERGVVLIDPEAAGGFGL